MPCVPPSSFADGALNLKTLHVLTIGSDAALATEFNDAVRGLKGYVAVTTTSGDLLRGAEIAIDRAPDVVLLPIESESGELKAFSDRLRAAHCAPLLIGACQHDESLRDGQVIISAMRSDVRDFVRRPLSSTELQDVLDRHFEKAAIVPPRTGRVIAMVSNKGGIGKSTLAVSIACTLAKRHPDRVLLIDASLQLGVCANALDLEPEATLSDAARERDRLDETLLRELTVRHDCGLRLLAAPLDAVDAARIDERALGRILGMARRAFDYVIVDTFPLLDAVALAILDLADRIYVITGSAVPHVLGTAKLLSIFDRMAVPRDRQRVVLNETHPRYTGAVGPREVAERLGRDLDRVVPYEKSLLTALNTGEPYALKARSFHGFGKVMKGWADDIERMTAIDREEEPS